MAWSGELGSCTWPDLSDSTRRGCYYPWGATEQHGPHLPPDTDTVIAVALAEAVARSFLRSRGGAGVAVRLHW
ncbi:MAG TPA: creatininase family protein [Solirubrobacteraceae bacterium]|nr:creatininase family protein [Solirubrobacteraceae bacterium]